MKNEACLLIIILAWEILTSGGRPYSDKNNVEVILAVVQDGARLNIPDHCPAALRKNILLIFFVPTLFPGQLILACWQTDPTSRPNFDQIGQSLAAMKN